MVLARVLAYIEFSDLFSGAKAPAGDLVRKLVERYRFEGFPKAIEELDPNKGVKFEAGNLGDVPISGFTVFSDGLVLETMTHSNASMAIINDILDWGRKEFGLNYVPGSIRRFGFVSNVTFYSDIPILEVNPSVSRLAERCTDEISKILNESLKYESNMLRVGHDPSIRKNLISPFIIEPRAETRRSDNKYFSAAPFPTDLHWELLEEYERNMERYAKAVGK